MKGLQKEVEDLPEHTGVEETILVNEISAQIMNAAEKLHEEKDLGPRRCFRKSLETRHHDSREANQPSDPRLLPRIWRGKQI
jgi:NH3-dependent NAD+ synthetase